MNQNEFGGTLTRIPDNEVILIKEFCECINKNDEYGDIIEFGTGSGRLTYYIANNIIKQRRIFTFDGFQGLPKTKKVIPYNTGWEEGKYRFNEQETRDLLKQYSNVIIEKTMTWNLKTPNEYGINKIIAANMDLDLYEGTLDGLEFIDKCNWNEITIRFDDWGCATYQKSYEFDEHEKAAFFDWIKEKKYQYEIDQQGIKKTAGRQSIIIVKR